MSTMDKRLADVRSFLAKEGAVIDIARNVVVGLVASISKAERTRAPPTTTAQAQMVVTLLAHCAGVS